MSVSCNLFKILKHFNILSAQVILLVPPARCQLFFIKIHRRGKNSDVPYVEFSSSRADFTRLWDAVFFSLSRLWKYFLTTSSYITIVRKSTTSPIPKLKSHTKLAQTLDYLVTSANSSREFCSKFYCWSVSWLVFSATGTQERLQDHYTQKTAKDLRITYLVTSIHTLVSFKKHSWYVVYLETFPVKRPAVFGLCRPKHLHGNYLTLPL